VSITLLPPPHIIERLALYQHIPRVMRLSVSTLFSDDSENSPRNGLGAMYSSHHVELYSHTSVRLARSVDTHTHTHTYIYIYIYIYIYTGPFSSESSTACVSEIRLVQYLRPGLYFIERM